MASFRLGSEIPVSAAVYGIARRGKIEKRQQMTDERKTLAFKKDL
jgi:hypothetical protein